jgi:transcriptional regulator with XRE-family HTH domain
MTRRVPLLHTYLAQRGLFARVAKKLGVDPSYVSRVANGSRHSKKITVAIEAELTRIVSSIRRNGKYSRSRSSLS